MLEVEFAQGLFADGEGLVHARAAGGEVASEELADLLTGALEFFANGGQDSVAQLGVFAEGAVFGHEVEVGASEGGLDVGEDVAEEGDVREGAL